VAVHDRHQVQRAKVGKNVVRCSPSIRCIVGAVARITVDVNEEWLEAARDLLGTTTKVATINAALESFARRKQAAAYMAAFDDTADWDFSGSEQAWRYGGGRDLSRLVENAREAEAAAAAEAG